MAIFENNQTSFEADSSGYVKESKISIQRFGSKLYGASSGVNK